MAIAPAPEPTTGMSSSLEGPNIVHLIDPKCFQALPVYNPPQPFSLTPPAEIANDADALFKQHFYRHAADAAKKEIIEIPAAALRTDAVLKQKVFSLWTMRQSALIVARLGTISREEARHLDELGSDRYRIGETGECIVPWRLRLIVVRVQAGGDTQVGITKYYSLAREARAQISRLRKKIMAYNGKKDDGTTTNNGKKEAYQAELKAWEGRLRNLGLFTSSMLLGMHDTKSALALLTSMHHDCDKLQEAHEEYKPFTYRVAFAIALVYLQIGDTISAREWFQRIEGNQFLQDFGLGVCAIADSDWESAESILKKVSLSTEDEYGNLANSKVSINNNLAVTKIYRGKLSEVSLV